MRSLKFALAALAATVAGSAPRSADPVKIRIGLGRAGVELGLDRAGEEGPRQAYGQVLHAGVGPLRRHAADDDGDRQRRARDRQPRLFDLPARGAERQHRRPARHRRRVPGRRHRLPQQRVLVLKDSPIKKIEDLKGKIIATNSIGSAVDIGSRAMLQEARPGGQARLHHRRGAVPHHEGDAEGEEGRPHSVGAAVQLRSRAQADLARRCSPARMPSACRSSSSGRRASPSSTRTAPRWSTSWRTCCVIERWFMDPKNHKRGRRDRVEGHQGAAGAVRLAVHQAGLLPQPGHAAEPRRAAIQHQH